MKQKVWKSGNIKLKKGIKMKCPYCNKDIDRLEDIAKNHMNNDDIKKVIYSYIKPKLNIGYI